MGLRTLGRNATLPLLYIERVIRPPLTAPGAGPGERPAMPLKARLEVVAAPSGQPGALPIPDL
jgi:hypothetical protein